MVYVGAPVALAAVREERQADRRKTLDVLGWE